MFTKKLNKIYVLGNNQEKKDIIYKLQDLGSLHISNSDLNVKDLISDSPLKGTDDLSLILLKIKYLVEQAKINQEVKIDNLADFEKIKSLANQMIQTKYDKVKNISEKIKSKKDKIKMLESRVKTIESLPFKIIREETNNLDTLLYESKKEFDFSTLKSKLVVTKITTEDKIYFKLTLPKKDKDSIIKKLSLTNLKRISISFLTGKSDEFKLKTKQQITDLKKEIVDLENKIQSTLDKNKLMYLYATLENYYAQHIISTKFQTSKNHFVIKAYVEDEQIKKIKEIENITIIKDLQDEQTPTKLDNKGPGKSFEKITKLFSLPKYGFIDPTKIISLFYPLFFGLMLSDVGYGLMLLILSLGLKYKFSNIDQYMNIMIISAIVTIISGFIFGSFFGELFGLQPLYQEPFSASFNLLIASLVIGLIHLNLGVFLKVLQLKTKNELDDFLDILKLPLIQIIVLLMVFKVWFFSIILSLILLAILYKQKSIFGFMDITNFFGTWFSYARILALNLATSGVALAVNILAEKTISFSIVVYVIILILGHLFNFVVNLIGCTINAARLHYVEFFSLFFESGGKPFKPFSIKKIITSEV